MIKAMAASPGLYNRKAELNHGSIELKATAAFPGLYNRNAELNHRINRIKSHGCVSGPKRNLIKGSIE